MTPERTRMWIVVLGAIVAASYALLRWFALPPPEAAAPRQARQDNEVRNVEMRVYDDTGKPNLVLLSPRIASPRRSEEYLIETPRFDVSNQDGARWKGQSRLGRLDVGKQLLWLQEQVVLDGTRPRREPVTIRSERIQFDLDQRLARSEEAVEIVSAGSRIRGVGLRADLKQSRFVLEKQVEGEYVPQRKQG
ncbi:MAG: hypothetical protein AMXMBFR25_23280 [Lysobacterales bacterium]|nr:Lipopolysaccharide export system protein LptC [Xanthomonadales bacterium]